MNYAGLVRPCATPTTASSGTAPSSPRGPSRVAADHGYAVELRGIGEPDDATGTPTQLAVFTRGGLTTTTARPHPRCPPEGWWCSSGCPGSGKSTFAREHFRPTEVVSSDFCRGLVADDENDQSATPDAFDVLHYLVGIRLRRGLLTVVDATNVQPKARASLVAVARSHDVLVDAIVLDVPESLALERNASRADRDFGSHVVRRQHRDLKRSLGRLRKEGFRRVHVLREADEVGRGRDRAASVRGTTARELHGPFDLVGDVHGCAARAAHPAHRARLAAPVRRRAGRSARRTPEGRTAVFVGDLVDRGPDTPGRPAPGHGHGR